jgi:O-methyltransferase involved in polyketide biosynthesis
VASLLEKLLLPGAVNHWLARKREIDRLARQAHADGFSQLLVIGGGRDTLALRMAAEGLFTRIIFADHPATLSSLPVLDPRVERVPWDLTSDEPLPTISPAATLVVIEGVLMFLPPPIVSVLLQRIAKMPVPRVRLIASWMVERPGQPIGFEEQSRFLTAWLRWRGEPMLWATTRERFTELLRVTGWPEPRFLCFALGGEQLAIAERRF